MTDGLYGVTENIPDYEKSKDDHEGSKDRNARDTADISVITFDVTVSENANEKPTVLDSINLEGVRGRSNPLETSHHEHIGNSGLEPEGGAAKDDIATGLPVFSSKHSDNKDTENTDHTGD